MASNNGWTDPELADIFSDDPGLEETARLLRASRPDPVIDEYFQRRLRGMLMQAAAERPARTRRVLPQRRAPRAPFWLRVRATHLAWGGVGVGVALSAATVIALVTGGQGHDRQRTVVATSAVAAQHLVSPAHAITVSFNQPMNHASVESGLRIQPATEVTTAWQGNDLVITPVHHLAGNTPYTVTIAQPALLASSGARATAPLQITFGTAPTPPAIPGVQAPPTLTTTDLGSAEPGGLLLFAPDGAVVVNAPGGESGAAPVTTPTPSPSPSATPSPSPSASPSASPAITLPTLAPEAPTPTPQPNGPVLEELPRGSGTPLVLGPAATAAAFSEDGTALASAVPSPQGGSDLLLSRADGTERRTLTHSAAPIVAVAWSTGTLEFATTQAVKSVDASGSVQPVASPAGTVAALSPDGARAYLAPGAGSPGRLYTIATSSVRALSGAGGVSGVAFSGDGSTIAWIDNASGHPRLLTEPAAVSSSSTVSVLDPGAELGTVALNRDGSRVAYTETTSSGTGRLVIAQVPTGAPVATGVSGSALAFSPSGSAIALLGSSGQGTQVVLGQLPGASPAAGVPAAATQVLHAFLDAQVRADRSALTALGLPGLLNEALLPPGSWRNALVDAVRQPDGSVQAIATFVLDPSTTRLTTLAADETLTLVPSGASYVVNALTLSPQHPLAAGPHVLSVTSSQQQSRLTVAVAFDSDLASDSVPAAITLQQPSGAHIPVTVSYDPNTRTATVTATQAPSGAVSVVVGIALRDINDASPPAVFTAPVLGG